MVTRFLLTNRERRRGGVICLGVVSFALIALAGTGVRADESSSVSSPGLTVASDKKAPPAVHVVATVASKADAPAAAKKTELEEMKDEFAALMKKRAGLEDQCNESMRRISAARDTTGGGAGANTETAVKYREAILVTEKALDAHPRVKALQELYEVAQTDKVAVSRLQSGVIDAWRKTREEKGDRTNAMLKEAGEKAEAERKAIFKAAGVKDFRKLSEDDQKRFNEIQARYTNEAAVARAAGVFDRAAELESREKDGSAKRFEELNARYKELEQTQAGLKKEMIRVRDELRKGGDPAIAKLERAAYEASQKHVAAMDAAPEVVAAHKFLENVDGERADIDKRVRVLRRAILTKDPEYKAVLDKLATAGGLALVGEDFWKEEG